MSINIQDYIPGINVGGTASLIINLVTFLILLIIIIGITGIIIYFIIRKFKYNKKIIIFERINERYEPSRKDVATEMKVGEAGDTLFYLKKHKKYLPTPSIQTGRNIFWYVIREDNEWINIGIEDIDKNMKRLNIKYLDKEMRYARVALQKNLKDRYQKLSFWSQYGGLVAYIGLIVIVGMMTWLLFDKYIEIANAINMGVENAVNVMEKIDSLLSKMDNICSGSGIRSVEGGT